MLSNSCQVYCLLLKIIDTKDKLGLANLEFLFHTLILTFCFTGASQTE